MKQMVVLALVACSMACSGRAPAGPAWPKPAAPPVDGGESLAPRAAARAIAAIVEEERPAERAAADKPAAAPAAASAAAPAAPATATPGQDEPLPTEEIVIEVDD
jgi:hypothetical protein